MPATATLRRSPPFWRYLRLTGRLEYMIFRGESESDAADLIRDLMDAPWYEMTDDEREWMGRFSLGLSPAELSAASVAAPQDRIRAAAALDRQQWRELLAVLQEFPRLLPEEQMAYLWGRAYSQVGEMERAVAHTEEAARLAPYKFRGALLRTLLDAGLLDEAVEEAGKVLRAEPQAEPRLLIEAANVLYRAGRTMPTEGVEVAMRQIQTALESALAQARSTGRPLPPAFEAGAYVTLAKCLESFGEEARASQAFDRAVEIDPDNAAARLARGWHLYGRDTETSVADFRRAAELEPRTFWAHFYLAHHALGKRNYNAVRFHATQALSTGGGERSALASLHEWMAIAAYEGLLAPIEYVVTAFSIATELDPTNPIIRANVERFEAVLQTRDGGVHQWQPETEQEVQGSHIPSYIPELLPAA